MAGWVAGENGNKANSASVEVEVEVEAELGNRQTNKKAVYRIAPQLTPKIHADMKKVFFGHKQIFRIRKNRVF